MNNKIRCEWAANPLFHSYHDTEWGVPVHDDKIHFEFLILEAAQAGLSWSTILKRRDGYKKAFANFDVNKVSKYTESDVEKLMQNSEIIRNRLKIVSAINNAKLFLQIQKDYKSFDIFVWGFVNNKTITNSPEKMSDTPTISKEANALSKDLIKRGFKFVGPTIIYAYMQAVGLTNDHQTECFRYKMLY